MSRMNVLRCERCHEYIFAEAERCRFCDSPVDRQAARLATRAQEKENRLYRRRHYSRHLMTGGAVLLAGVLITAGTYVWAGSSPEGGQYLFTYGLILAGAGDFLYGLGGWMGEMR